MIRKQQSKARKARDFRAEYERRIARALAKGLSRSQARGHARPGEAGIKRAKPKDTDLLAIAYRKMREVGSLTAAAKAHRIAPERLRSFIHERSLAERKGRSWTFTDTLIREMKVISKGDIRTRRLAGAEEASLNGQHLAAVKAFISSNDRALLRPFEGRSVMDAKGKAHPLETDPNVLHRLAAAGGEVFHDIYRLTI